MRSITEFSPIMIAMVTAALSWSCAEDSLDLRSQASERGTLESGGELALADPAPNAEECQYMFFNGQKYLLGNTILYRVEGYKAPAAGGGFISIKARKIKNLCTGEVTYFPGQPFWNTVYVYAVKSPAIFVDENSPALTDPRQIPDGDPVVAYGNNWGKFAFEMYSLKAHHKFVRKFTSLPLAGNWDGSGEDVVTFTKGVWRLDLDGQGGAAEKAFSFGIATDIPLTGDWDGDGKADAVVFREGMWYMDADQTGGAGERAVAFGAKSDIPVMGDWNGDGRADMGLFRKGLWLLDLDGQGGQPERTVGFGAADDIPMVGDWNGDGKADFAVFRSGKWFFDLDNNGGAGEKAYSFGIPDDLPLVGDFNPSLPGDEVAIYRKGVFFLDLDGKGGAGEKTVRFK